MLTPKVREFLAPMSDLIAVGPASDEGKRAEEEARALTRSKTVAAWIKIAVKPEIALWTLTLGQYEKTCTVHEDQDLNFEQPIVIGVRSKADGTNLQEALSDADRRPPELSWPGTVIPLRYGKFDNARPAVQPISSAQSAVRTSAVRFTRVIARGEAPTQSRSNRSLCRAWIATAAKAASRSRERTAIRRIQHHS